VKIVAIKANLNGCNVVDASAADDDDDDVSDADD